ncbi:hypothetical protein HanIR_Chr02g0073681 [Helianthus annuus]|nr:hypothetical protein HanIR_Chr02g0073681 [Helianthus annuus]
MEEEVDLGDSLELMFGAEEEIEEVEIKSSGEDEFLELELDGLPIYEEVGVLDPDGDIAYFDALLEGELTEVIEPAPDEETECGDRFLKVVEEEEHHSWPLVLLIDETSESIKPQERAKNEKEESENERGSKVGARWKRRRHYSSRMIGLLITCHAFGFFQVSLSFGGLTRFKFLKYFIIPPIYF